MPNKDKEQYNAYMREYMKKRYEKNVAWMREYKIQQGCADCGWNKHHAGLEFDHLESRHSDDSVTVARLMGKSIKRIQAEIAKCEVVCGTCHNMRTWNRRQNDMGV